MVDDFFATQLQENEHYIKATTVLFVVAGAWDSTRFRFVFSGVDQTAQGDSRIGSVPVVVVVVVVADCPSSPRSVQAAKRSININIVTTTTTTTTTNNNNHNKSDRGTITTPYPALTH
jgi:hypothetical protein